MTDSCEHIHLCYFRTWDCDLHGDLSRIRNVFSVLDVLLEVLDPLQEGMAGGVAKATGKDENYEGMWENFEIHNEATPSIRTLTDTYISPQAIPTPLLSCLAVRLL